jgi:hypothetical protein
MAKSGSMVATFLGMLWLLFVKMATNEGTGAYLWVNLIKFGDKVIGGWGILFPCLWIWLNVGKMNSFGVLVFI